MTVPPVPSAPSIAQGAIQEGVHYLKERVQYEHTDFSGFVYHARYLDFLEHGRSDCVRMLGIDQTALYEGAFGEPLAFGVHRMDLRFHASARLNDILTVETPRANHRGARLWFDQKIRREDAPILDARVTLVLMNREGKARRFPEKLLRKLGAVSQEI